MSKIYEQADKIMPNKKQKEFFQDVFNPLEVT